MLECVGTDRSTTYAQALLAAASGPVVAETGASLRRRVCFHAWYLHTRVRFVSGTHTLRNVGAETALMGAVKQRRADDDRLSVTRPRRSRELCGLSVGSLVETLETWLDSVFSMASSMKRVSCGGPRHPPNVSESETRFLAEILRERKHGDSRRADSLLAVGARGFSWRIFDVWCLRVGGD